MNADPGKPRIGRYGRRGAPLALALVALAAWSRPAPSGPAAIAESPLRLRLLAYNIHHGAGNDGVLDLGRIARVIRSVEPHLVALQEVDRIVERTAGVDQAAELGRLTGMGHVFGPFMDYQGGEYGMAVLSQLPIVESSNHRLPAGPEPRTALTVRVSLPGEAGELTFAGIHFYRTPEERLAQARRLLGLLAGEPRPVVLAGDFNSTRDSAVMRLVGETYAVAHKEGASETFPSHEPRREIDFLAFRPAERFEVVESRVVDEAVASDHRPVLLVLELRSEGSD